jgi:hypothetical protein
VRPPTQYFGSKGRLAPWIASLLPTHRTYLEPFAGSATVLFAKPLSPTEVINDRDHDMIVFRVLRDRGPELARALHSTLAAVLISGYPSPLYAELYDQAGWWCVECEVDKPSSLTPGGRAAHAVEAVWSNRPLHQQLQLAAPPGPGPITQGVQP